MKNSIILILFLTFNTCLFGQLPDQSKSFYPNTRVCGNMQLQKIYTQQWYDGEYLGKGLYRYEYLPTGSLAKEASCVWKDDHWMEWSKKVYTYNNNNLPIEIEFVVRNPWNHNWENHQKQTHHYYEDDSLAETKIYFTTGAAKDWKYSGRNLYSYYDVGRHRVKESRYFYSADSQQTEHRYLNSDGQLIEFDIRDAWGNPYESLTNKYNELGQLEQTISKSYSRYSSQPVSQHMLRFYYSGQKLNMLRSYSVVGNKWVLQNFRMFVYNDLDKLIRVSENWIRNGQTVPSKVIDYEYDENGCLCLQNEHRYNDSIWQLTFERSYHWNLTTGINQHLIDQNNEGYLKVYPNPSAGLVHLKVPDALVNDVGLQVVNYGGQVVYQKSVAISSLGEQLIPFDLSNNAAGIYQVILTTEHDIFSAKVILK